MKISKSGLNLIKSFEGLRLKAYKPVATEKYYTIGYGHYGADVSRETTITKEQAEQLLKSDIMKFEKAVTDLNLKLEQCEFDALTSFAYNCGIGNLKRLVAGRNKLQIADALLLYTKAGGKTLNGLVLRRKKERELFLSNDNTETIAKEVINGKWGNGAERKRRLTEAGYDYNRVQMYVNKLLTGD